MRFRSTKHYRRSLRHRLAFAFALVALLSVTLGFMVSAHTQMMPGPAKLRFLIPLFIVAAWAGGFTASRIIRSLERLGQAVERLDLRDLSLRVPTEGEDEVAALARAFNQMVDRLAAEERVRRELFADIAHELRHPLAVLRGRLELLQDGVVPMNQEQVLYLQEMVIGLSRLVGDLRDLSLAEVGRLSLAVEAVDLGALIADLIENMEPVAADRSIRLTANVGPGLEALPADRDRIRQVLVNLLANALHYTPQGGSVTVSATAAGAQAQVSVTDTGPGISPEDLPHLFDRFYRADKSRTRGTGGSGLGLAIVRSLVELHGGSVQVESKVGEGSRFVVVLPRK